jgi:thymidylate synthase ThyX
MKVTQVAICPSEASKKAGRPALTPELLAASGARYSRNNEGLESILSKIDPANLEKSVDSIFRMVDYGHQSIADMVPVTMFIDGVSIWLAYYIWTLCPTAGGQESSTRYIKISLDGVIPAEELRLNVSSIGEWRTTISQCFYSYHEALRIWEEAAAKNPALMGIPKTLLADESETARKKVARMRRNYAFDRARYFLPASAATNLMMIMSARGWVNLCQHLLSHPLPEAVRAGELIREELELCAPRMIRHARCTESVRQSIGREFEKCVRLAAEDEVKNTPYMTVTMPDGISAEDVCAALAFHDNRYAPIGSALQRTAVRFGWPAMGFAEIRDLNRHRTGTKYCPLVPKGFYFALDQAPPESRNALEQLARDGEVATGLAVKFLQNSDPTYIYWTLLGTEFPFEHMTTADKFIYEAELRTGLGAHFRYAKHLHDVLSLFYDKFPATKGMILEGAAEPE